MSCSKDITVFPSVNKQMTLKWKYKYNLLEQVHIHNYLHKNELKLYNTSLITLSKFLILLFSLGAVLRNILRRVFFTDCT